MPIIRLTYEKQKKKLRDKTERVKRAKTYQKELPIMLWPDRQYFIDK